MSNNQDTNYLNLSRKWRSKQFDQLVGQSLVVRLIKNSLYRNLFFPVYLFSGPKGSGKTSTARIFATALNCSSLGDFQKKPQKTIIPCLTCHSCIAMQKQSHPDFIEIDAASNTGVDNVRILIDNSTFVPVLGKKKVYLIDEAHMLSKAAFNALLKIFEEPPASVVFMLATTDPNKIIETVRSRCFQLFFKGINVVDMIEHLRFVCNEENILFEESALEVISLHAKGSLRDGLNLVEQAKLISTKIEKKLVIDLLGFIDSSIINDLLITILDNNTEELLNLYSKYKVAEYNAYEVFKKIKETLHELLLKAYSKNNDLNKNQLLEMLEYCYSQEVIFSKTATPVQLLQAILIRLSQISLKDSNIKKKLNLGNLENNTQNINKLDININKKVNKLDNSNDHNLGELLTKLNDLNDPLLSSLFKQATLNLVKNNGLNKLDIIFNQDSDLFLDILENKKDAWYKIIKSIYGDNVEINHSFGMIAPIKNNHNNNNISGTEVKPPIKPINMPNTIKGNSLNVNSKLDLTDHNKWPYANKLLKIFPGIVTHD